MPTATEYWGGIATQINNGLTLRRDEYFDQYLQPNTNDNPFAVLDPSYHDKFFGPKVLSILIISRPYGWTKPASDWVFSWPPPGLDDTLDRIRTAYPMWGKFQVAVYGDYSLGRAVVDEFPDPDFAELEAMLAQTFGELEGVCNSNADIGFTWEGEFDIQPDPGVFTPLLNSFYGSA